MINLKNKFRGYFFQNNEKKKLIWNVPDTLSSNPIAQIGIISLLQRKQDLVSYWLII